MWFKKQIKFLLNEQNESACEELYVISASENSPIYYSKLLLEEEKEEEEEEEEQQQQQEQQQQVEVELKFSYGNLAKQKHSATEKLRICTSTKRMPSDLPLKCDRPALKFERIATFTISSRRCKRFIVLIYPAK